MAVPADATEPLVLEWREWWTDGSENIVATTRAEAGRGLDPARRSDPGARRMTPARDK